MFQATKGKEKLGEEEENALLPNAIFTLHSGQKYKLRNGHFTFKRAMVMLALPCRCPEAQAAFPSTAPTRMQIETRFFRSLSASGRRMGTTPHGTLHLQGIYLTLCTQTGNPGPVWEKQILYLYEGGEKSHDTKVPRFPPVVLIITG